MPGASSPAGRTPADAVTGSFESAWDGIGPDDHGTNRVWAVSDSSGRRNGAARTKWLVRMPAARNGQPCASQSEVGRVGQRPKPRCLLLSAVTCFTSPLLSRSQRPRSPVNSDIVSTQSGAGGPPVGPVQRAPGTDNLAWEGDSRYDERRWAVRERGSAACGSDSQHSRFKGIYETKVVLPFSRRPGACGDTLTSC
jgi:hypothetical protein